MASFQLTYADVLTLLLIVAVGMLIVILYHFVFVSIALRRFSGRVDSLSKDLETMILKPIGAVEHVIDWVVASIDGVKSGKKKTAHQKKSGD